MIGSLISAGASLLGGILGNNQQEKNAERNIQLQKDFAQQGIRWKVEDAKAAGIHPLYALGANTNSFAPVSVGSDLSTGIANMGQDLSRAIDAGRTSGERANAVTKTMQDLSLQKMGLENELLAAQIAKIRQPGSPPARPGADPMLIGGQAQTIYGEPVPPSLLVNDQPLERVRSAPGLPHQEGAAVSDYGFTRTPTGYAPVYSNDAKQRLEDDTLGMLSWNLRNRIIPSVMGYSTAQQPNVALPPGYDYWYYNPWRQEYQPAKY